MYQLFHFPSWKSQGVAYIFFKFLVLCKDYKILLEEKLSQADQKNNKVLL